MVDAAVERLVDEMLAEAPAAVREASDRAGILRGLYDIGACNLATLGSLLSEDYAEVKTAVVNSTKPGFVSMLAAAMRDGGSRAWEDMPPSTPSTGRPPPAPE